MSGTVIWDASDWLRGDVDLRVRIASSGTLNAFDDRLRLRIDNREREDNPDGDYHHQFNYSKASIRGPSNGDFEVRIGGVEAGSIEEPTPQEYRPVQSVPIPITLESGRHDVTVAGHKIGTVTIYNRDYPPATPEPSESAPTPDPSGSSSGSSGDPAASNSPTPDPSGGSGTDTTSSGMSRAGIAIAGVAVALLAAIMR